MKFAGLAAVMIVATAAGADEPRLPPNVTCDMVRARVAEFGWAASYAWARLNGYTVKQIREAEKCLRR